MPWYLSITRHITIVNSEFYHLVTDIVNRIPNNWFIAVSTSISSNAIQYSHPATVKPVMFRFVDTVRQLLTQRLLRLAVHHIDHCFNCCIDSPVTNMSGLNVQEENGSNESYSCRQHVSMFSCPGNSNYMDISWDVSGLFLHSVLCGSCTLKTYGNV